MKPRIFLAVILLYSFAYAVDFPSEESLKPYEGRIIRSITIVSRNIFENEEGTNLPFYYRWANKLHIKTRKSVIEGELLFKPGDRLDIEKVIESARNIRLRKFIAEVNIVAKPNGNEGVDLTVTSLDNWTTKAAASLERGGGTYLYGISLAEDNLLGYGRIIQVSGSKSNDNEGYTIFFEDNRIGRTRWAGKFLFADFTLSRSIILSLNKPQYSLDVPYGFSSGFQLTDGTTRLFSGGDEFFRYKRKISVLDLRSVYSLGRETRADFYLSYKYENFDNSNYYDSSVFNSILIPSDERRSYPSIGIGGSVIKYYLGRYLDEPGTPEDLTLGGFLALNVGRSIPEFGANYMGTITAISSSFLLRPFERMLVGGRDHTEWWYHRGRSEKINQVWELMIYYKTAESHVLAARALTNFAWREKPGYQLILGGANGLRGYSSFELDGQKLALANVEYRFYTALELFTVRLGGAMFFDIGEVWKKGERISLDDPRYDVGLGLRFGLTRSSTARVLRLDIARPLTRDDIYISIVSGMVFSLSSIVGHD
jgi:hypothetical protein